jgi:hypothetical protein
MFHEIAPESMAVTDEIDHLQLPAAETSQLVLLRFRLHFTCNTSRDPMTA